MEKFIKENKALLVAIILVLILLISGTFAWLRLTKTASSVNKIKAGSLVMELDDASASGIKLLNQMPMSYQKGMATQEYTFTLTNSGTTTNDYTITLEDIASYVEDDQTIEIQPSEKLDDSLIRYCLLKNGEVADPSKSHLLSEASGRVIDSGTIAGDGTSYTYSLRIWIDSKAGDGATEANVMGKKFNAGLLVEATQHQAV